MTKANRTRTALFTSILSLLLCVSMLVGTTFAWFTDAVESGVNTITAGNLDIEVYYAYPSDVVDGDIPAENWKKVEADKSLFNKDALWEPGYTEVVFFKFANEGTLSLQYQMMVDILSETKGATKDGAEIQLSDHIMAYVNNTFDFNYKAALYTERASALNPTGAPDPFYGPLSEVANMDPCRADDYTVNPLSLDSWQWLEPEETTYATLVLWMPTTVGNEANYAGAEIPTIDLGINVVATQYSWEQEKDSFDHKYDENAEFPVVYDHVVGTLDELKAALAEGGNILLTENIDITETLKVTGGTEVYLDLNGKTITLEDGQNAATVQGVFVTSFNSKLTITGNGTVDVGNNATAFLLPAGDVTIENGTFIRDLAGINLDNAYPLISGYSWKYHDQLGDVVINGGYFDGGYYDTAANNLFDGFVETDAAGQNNSKDKNETRIAVKNNVMAVINLSDPGNFEVFGGTFVGANPAWGDEGAFLPTNYNGNYLRPWSYYQGGYIPGQTFNENGIVLPDGWSIVEGVTDTGIPTYTVVRGN